jgi:hypothetical protein
LKSTKALADRPTRPWGDMVMGTNADETRADMIRRVGKILDLHVDEDYVYDRGAGRERKVTTFDRKAAAAEIGGMLAELVLALEGARVALSPEYADVGIGEGPEYATCPTCDGRGWSPGRVQHGEGCIFVLCEATLDRAKGIGKG